MLLRNAARGMQRFRPRTPSTKSSKFSRRACTCEKPANMRRTSAIEENSVAGAAVPSLPAS